MTERWCNACSRTNARFAMLDLRMSQTIRGRCLHVMTRIPKAELTGIYGALIKYMARKMISTVAGC